MLFCNSVSDAVIQYRKTDQAHEDKCERVLTTEIMEKYEQTCACGRAFISEYNISQLNLHLVAKMIRHHLEQVDLDLRHTILAYNIGMVSITEHGEIF